MFPQHVPKNNNRAQHKKYIITYLCKGHFIGVSLERPFVYKNLGLGPSMLKSQTLELKHRTLKPKNLNPI